MLDATAPTQPQWWNEHIAAAWARSRAAALEDWTVHGDRTDPPNLAIVEHALAFGHGARSAYPGFATWQAAAEQLRADWTHLGNVGTAAWDRVAVVIRHEWSRAAGPGGDAAPEPS
jgi:hypothetical protein